MRATYWSLDDAKKALNREVARINAKKAGWITVCSKDI